MNDATETRTALPAIGISPDAIPEASRKAIAEYRDGVEQRERDLAEESTRTGLSRLAILAVRRVGRERAEQMMPHLFA